MYLWFSIEYTPKIRQWWFHVPGVIWMFYNGSWMAPCPMYEPYLSMPLARSPCWSKWFVGRWILKILVNSMILAKWLLTLELLGLVIRIIIWLEVPMACRSRSSRSRILLMTLPKNWWQTTCQGTLGFYCGNFLLLNNQCQRTRTDQSYMVSLFWDISNWGPNLSEHACKADSAHRTGKLAGMMCAVRKKRMWNELAIFLCALGLLAANPTRNDWNGCLYQPYCFFGGIVVRFWAYWAMMWHCWWVEWVINRTNHH